MGAAGREVLQTIRAALALALLLALPARAAGEAEPPAQPPAEERVAAADREPRARQWIAKMRELSAQVDKLTEQARAEKDIVKLNCVSEKSSTLRGLVRVSDQAADDLHESTARKDDYAAGQSWAKLTIARRKVTQLRTDAEQCIGQLAFYNDEKTQVEVDIPPGLPSSDLTAIALPAPVESRPPPASGF